MTVRGPIAAATAGMTLVHEHILANFQPYDEWERAPRTYDRDVVVALVLPHLKRIRDLGCRTFVDATAVGLGRDAVLLRRLSEESGLNVLCTTGNYAAVNYQFLPRYVFDSSDEQLAQRWISEWLNGIDGTGVRPGFIKLSVNGGRLSDVERKLIRAGCLAHRATGMVIGVHTGPAEAAFDELDVLREMGVSPSSWMWIHAQVEKDWSRHVAAARQGAWISLDGVNAERIDEFVRMVANLRDAGFLRRTLVSQDAGWYSVGQPQGGKFRPYDVLLTQFLTALRAHGFSADEVDTVMVRNPAAAFRIRTVRA